MHTYTVYTNFMSWCDSQCGCAGVNSILILLHDLFSLTGITHSQTPVCVCYVFYKSQC